MSTKVTGAVLTLAIRIVGIYFLWHWFGWHGLLVGALMTVTINE